MKLSHSKLVALGYSRNKVPNEDISFPKTNNAFDMNVFQSNEDPVIGLKLCVDTECNPGFCRIVQD